MRRAALLTTMCLSLGCTEAGGVGGGPGTGGSAGAAGGAGTSSLCDTGVGGAVGMGGSDGTDASCIDDVCPCSVAGIRAAIRAGGGPYTFDCEGPTTVVVGQLEDRFLIDRDVSLDGEGELTVKFGFFGVDAEVTAELRGLTVACGGVSVDFGTLTVANSTVVESPDRGIVSIGGLLDLTNTSVLHSGGHGIANGGPMTMANSTIADNGGFGITTVVNRIGCSETLITNSTVSGNGGGAISNCGEVTMTNTVIAGECTGSGLFQSEGGNLESPGDTCGFDHPTDQVNVGAGSL